MVILKFFSGFKLNLVRLSLFVNVFILSWEVFVVSYRNFGFNGLNYKDFFNGKV